VKIESDETNDNTKKIRKHWRELMTDNSTHNLQCQEGNESEEQIFQQQEQAWGSKYTELLDGNVAEVEQQGMACHADTFRTAVFRATVELLQDQKMLEQVQQQAEANLSRWKAGAGADESQNEWFSETYADNRELCKRVDYQVKLSATDTVSVFLCEGDWGEVAQKLTQQFGETFAVLNMANAFVAGGGVVEGMIAQEENMYRRSDCWLKARASSKTEEAAPERGIGNLYYEEELAETATLDSEEPRVCFIGQDVCGYQANPELVSNSYCPLPTELVFPFYELKAAAYDTRPFHNWASFERKYLKGWRESMRKRMHNQFEELASKQVRHVVLSAFGCGAFINRAWPQNVQQDMVRNVARMYLESIEEHGGSFDVIAFGIYDGAGYGATANSRLFHEVFSQQRGGECTDTFTTPVKGGGKCNAS
jgi:hypothetical protein